MYIIGEAIPASPLLLVQNWLFVFGNGPKLLPLQPIH